MPRIIFGSLVGGWATIKKGDANYTLEQYLEDTKQMFKHAMSHILSVYKVYEQIEIDDTRNNTPDIPTK